MDSIEFFKIILEHAITFVAGILITTAIIALFDMPGTIRTWRHIYNLFESAAVFIFSRNEVLLVIYLTFAIAPFIITCLVCYIMGIDTKKNLLIVACMIWAFIWVFGWPMLIKLISEPCISVMYCQDLITKYKLVVADEQTADHEFIRLKNPYSVIMRGYLSIISDIIIGPNMLRVLDVNHNNITMWTDDLDELKKFVAAHRKYRGTFFAKIYNIEADLVAQFKKMAEVWQMNEFKAGKFRRQEPESIHYDCEMKIKLLGMSEDDKKLIDYWSLMFMRIAEIDKIVADITGKGLSRLWAAYGGPTPGSCGIKNRNIQLKFDGSFIIFMTPIGEFTIDTDVSPTSFDILYELVVAKMCIPKTEDGIYDIKNIIKEETVNAKFNLEHFMKYREMAIQKITCD